jgi:23S rRNA (uracil1939-C5)-methyltransferase
MTVGEIVTGQVESIAAGGAGVAHWEGRTVFVDAAGPGDVVAARIREVHDRWALADLLEITEASPSRIPPACGVYETCGGCSLQHIAYSVQLAEKKTILHETVRRIGGLPDIPKIPVYSSRPFEYRNRVQFHRVPGGSNLGFKSRNSINVIPLTDCPVADPAIRRALKEKRLPPPPEKDRFTVYARGKTFLSEGGTQRGIAALLDRELRIDAGVFFQSNGDLLEQMIKDLIGIAQTADLSLPAADVYCGIGTFGAFLRDYCSRIDLVEQHKTALALARENVRGPKCRYAALSADQWVQTLDPKAPASYGFITLDPPRQGLSPLLRSWLAEAGAPVLVYASCNPASLARDSQELTKGGYTLTELRLYDFYPQTPHIESLAVFKRARP